MATENIFIAHPTTIEQINALKAIVIAFKIEFELTKKEDNTVFVKEMQSSLNQVQEMRTGRLPKQSIKDFLNEL